MLAAAVLAASLLAPSGVTATIQADPVCLPTVALPGHSYEFTVTASGGNLTLVPDTLDAAPLEQVPASWVSFGSSTVTLSVPQDAAAGPYQSLIEVTAPGGSGNVSLGSAATTALVFAVGANPPPCGALYEAQSTGVFPGWPTPAFATTGWKQVFARQQASGPKPVLSPTAGTRNPPASVRYAPASPAASQGSAGNGKNLIGWALLAGVALYVPYRIFGRKE